MQPKQSRLRALQRETTRLERRIDVLKRVTNRYAWARLGTFSVGATASLLILIVGGLWAGILGVVLTLITFAVVARKDRQVKQGLARHRLWLVIKRSHIARMELDWTAIPPERLFQSLPASEIGTDLDLIGTYSLSRLIDTCVSCDASDRLRGWLVAGVPQPEQITRRQALVRELRPMILFRDKLRLYATLDSRGQNWHWDQRGLLGWLEHLDPARPLPLRLLAGLAGINMALFVLFQAGLLPPLWPVSFVVYFGVYLWYVQQLGDPFDKGLALRDPLYDLQAVFTFLEDSGCTRRKHVRELCTPFLDRAKRPSAQLRRLTRVLSAASVRRNPLLWFLLSMVIPWDIFVAHGLQKRQGIIAALLPQWLDVLSELEALSALANLGYLNPDYTFPEVVFSADKNTQPLFEARALGHPLIPDNERICNDFVLRQSGELAMITGSNMSGKSTFLRTVGINLCLAYAGGPVSAQHLRTAPLRLYTCIRVTDSVADGISYFYAEVRRLRALLEGLAENQDHVLPLLYLIDEIFRGTNNRERLIGSRSYIRAVVGGRGVGVLSTHDLELVHLADQIPQITNYHFRETITGRRMTFDYTLRPGSCPTTNALTIMRLEGLPVEDETAP